MLPRLYVEEPLGPDARLALEGERAHYLARVMRRRPGDVVRLFNGRDGEWEGRILEIDRRSTLVAVGERLAGQWASPALHLVFAPTKRGMGEGAVRQATEHGAAHIHPVLAERSVVDRVNIPRLERIAVEAAEQCGRLDLPRIADMVPLPDLLASWPASRPLVVFDPDAETLAIDRAPEGGVLVGPEGGLAPGELDALGKLGFVRVVRMGPRLLKAETAVVSALTLWQLFSGDWP